MSISSLSVAELNARGFSAVGKTFARLTVVEYLPNNRGGRFRCRCACGRDIVVFSYLVLSGLNKSCASSECTAAMRRRTHGCAGRHGKQTPEYRIWSQMKARCHNPRNSGYRRYGGRGIEVCTEWRDSFEAFLKDMGRKPSPAHTLERINNDGNYEACNCVWATMRTQMRNTSKTRRFLYAGEMRPMVDIAEMAGVNYGSFYFRLITKGLSVEESVRSAKAQVLPTIQTHVRLLEGL